MSEQVPIGARLRAARLAKNLTLEAVAGSVGITAGYLSRLERDQVSPSVASLVAICSALGLRVGELFEPPPSAIVRAGEGSRINFGAVGAREYVITPGSQTHLEVIQSYIDPGGHGGESQYVLDCEVEFVFVVAGSFELLLGDEVHTLGPGDAMTFRGGEPHTWRNVSFTDVCEVVWVLTPAP